MDYRILGPLEVIGEAGPLSLGGTKQRAFLAVLLLRANQVTSVDTLMDALWGDEPPDSAANVLQTYASRLRKALDPAKTGAASPLITRPPGYVLHVGQDEIDVQRFERLAEQGRQALAQSNPSLASKLLGDALAQWRGPPLADFTYEPFARSEIERLEDRRLAALEDRLDADLALGRAHELVGEIQALVNLHPLQERLRARLMVALYRSGRQAEALQGYREIREALADELGIDPGPELQRLEVAILNQDPSLMPDAPESPPTQSSAAAPDLPLRDRSIALSPRDPGRLPALLSIAESLAQGRPAYDLLVARLLGPWEGSDQSAAALSHALRQLGEQRSQLATRGIPSRVVAFNSTDPARDLARLASDHPVELLLTDAPSSLFESDGEALVRVLELVECDVAILLRSDAPEEPSDQRPVLTPFGGADHDWAALQMAASLARVHQAPLHLVGSAADIGREQRDASRLLGHASLVVQRLTGIVAEPVLVEPGDGVLRATKDVGLIVMGLSDHWQTGGLGTLRAEIAASASAPTLVVRRGMRSSAPMSGEDQTRFTWSRTGDLSAG